MKANKSLKLRIEQNGKVTDRHLRGNEEFTVGRSPENDVVLYGDKFPKRLRLFVPSNGGYELRLADDSRGEIVLEKSKLAFSDLLQHNLLPKRDGCATMPLTPGKSGHLILDSLRIDFNFDGAEAEAFQFDGFSPMGAFRKTLREDPFFKGLVAALLILQLITVQWASTVEIKPLELADQTKLLQKVQKIAATFKSAEALRPKPAASAETNTTPESSNEEKKEETKEEPKTAEAGEKKDYGSDKPGEGVNLENVGVLALIGSTGSSDANNGLMDRLIKDDLAKGIDKVMTSGKLSAGRSQSGNSSTDLNALLAYGELGEGKGGNSSIDEILKNDVTKNKPAVKLEKTGKVSVEQLGKVSGSEEAKGARGEESLLQMLRQNMGRLKYIYDKYLKTNPEIGGKLEVEVIINADGSIANAIVLSSEIPLDDFKREIVAAIRRWKYETITQGQVKVVYPIIFIKTN
jgi:TonB family protein